MGLEHLDSELRELDAQGLLRTESAPLEGFDACSNDYLGFAREPVSRETLEASAQLAGGSGASRLIHGTRPIHLALEAELADWVRLPSALLMSSGYAANVGALSALARRGDVIVSDELNHASIIDGCRLSRAEVEVFPHLDLEAVEAALARHPSRRCWVVTESYFSMDGDSPALGALRTVCDRYDAALVVDEAHALGVFGPEGAGRCVEADVRPDVLVGTLGKAVGLQGAFISGSTSLRNWLWNRARSLVFSTAPSPLLSGIVLERIRAVRSADDRRARLAENVAAIRARLSRLGLRVLEGSAGPVIPLLVGDNAVAVEVARGLASRGIRAQAIRPPTVPTGSARLRITVDATATLAQLDELTDALGELLGRPTAQPDHAAPEGG